MKAVLYISTLLAGCAAALPADKRATATRGDMTWYDVEVGLGACGHQDDATDLVVALNDETMGPKSNRNPFCGRQMRINYNGKEVIATIHDKCPGCGPNDIDVSEGIFRYLVGDPGKGRVQVDWEVL